MNPIFIEMPILGSCAIVTIRVFVDSLFELKYCDEPLSANRVTVISCAVILFTLSTYFAYLCADNLS